MREFVPNTPMEKKQISCKSYGVVGSTLLMNGSELTFFCTDFLELERVAWYCADKFSPTDYHEKVPDEVLESIHKNGGFFLTRNFLSFDSDGKVVNTEGKEIRDVSANEANIIAANFEIPSLVSELPYGMIYDVLGQWLLKTGTLTLEEWLDSPTTESEQERLLTRDCGGWCLKDILGNIFKREWTQERYDGNCAVVRGGTPFFDGEARYPSRMRYTIDEYSIHPDAKVRAFLYYE